MRETKFRGKVIEKQEELEAMGVIDKNGWATGNLIQNEQHTMIVGDLLEFDDEDMMCDWWVPVIPETVEQIKAEHNENQQIVLEHLKKSSGKEGCLVLAVSTLSNIKHCPDVDGSKYFKKIRKAFWSLTRKQEAEVLQAFAEWGLSDEYKKNI